MKLEINLSDENAFLSEIKKIVKQQVTSIAREEYIAIVKDVFEQKLSTAFPSNMSVEDVVKREVTTQIRQIISESIGKSYNKDFIKDTAREMITNVVKERLTKGDF